jgi:ATP-dependent 26S proteasome regulatory subunit
MRNETFLLIEEIDTVGAKKRSIFDDDVPEESPSMVEDAANKKLKDLLTILDGIHTPEGLVIFLTTNHIEKLDAALIRPGRVDYRLTFKAPDKSQIESACKYYLGDSWEPTYKKLVKAKPASMAFVQEALIQEYLNK